MKTITTNLAIIGAGPGGIYSHYYAHHKGLNSYLIEASNKLGGQPSNLFASKSIHDFPAFNCITGQELINRFVDQIKDLNNVILNTSLKDIETENNKYKLTFNNDLVVFCDYVIISTGPGFFEYNKVDGLHFDNIHYEVKDLKSYENKDVIVLGGGDSAIDWTNELSKHNLKSLTIVHRRNEFRATGKNVEDVKNNSNIKVLMNKTSKVIDKNKLQVIDNDTKKEDILNFDNLIVQYGTKFNIENNLFLKKFNLDKQNKIIVNSCGQTNLKNIYAIGNIASFDNKPLLISIAVTDAIKAIENIVKNIKQYDK